MTAWGLKHGLMPQPHRPLMADCSPSARLTQWQQPLPSGHSGPFSLGSTLNFSRVHELHSNQARPMGQGELGVDLPSGYPDESYPGFAAPLS